LKAIQDEISEYPAKRTDGGHLPPTRPTTTSLCIASCGYSTYGAHIVNAIGRPIEKFHATATTLTRDASVVAKE